MYEPIKFKYILGYCISVTSLLTAGLRHSRLSETKAKQTMQLVLLLLLFSKIKCYIFLNPHVPIPPSYNPLILTSTTYYPSTALLPPKLFISIPLIHPNSCFKNQTLCNHLGFISFAHPFINGCNSLRSLPEFTSFFSAPFYTTLTTMTAHNTFI